MPAPGEPLRVVVAGGGFAGVEVILALRAVAGDRIEIELVSNDDALRFRPLAVSEPFGAGPAESIALDELCAEQGVRRVRARVTAVDAPAHRITTDATEPIGYDALVLAVGARRTPSLPGALTFDGRRGIEELRRLVDEIASGAVGSVAFAVPGAATWTLPIYEVALLTRAELERRGIDGARLTVVTPEARPLELFGALDSDRVASLLADRGIAVHLGGRPERIGRAHGADALLTSTGAVAADRVVALPSIEGPRIPGVANDADGFIRTDLHGLVDGTSTVYAAGDATWHPVKQGGLATQQADAVAVAIAARAGVPIDPRPFDPRMRGWLLTGGEPLRLGDPGGGEAPEPFRPTQKVVGRHLSRWLDRG